MKTTRFVPVIVFLLAALTGCQTGLTEQQRAWLTRGEDLYRQERYNDAVAELTRFLTAVPDAEESARALYIRGMSRAQAGSRSQAYADLRQCSAMADAGEYAWRAFVVLGTLGYEDRAWTRAAEDLRMAAKLMPNAPPKDAVLYRLGLCYERSGRWEEARPGYREIVAAYGGGSYGDAAKRRLRLNATQFAVQCGAFYDASNADNLVHELGRGGISAYINPEQRGRQILHVVLVGRYDTREEAERQRDMIRAEHVPDAVVWP